LTAASERGDQFPPSNNDWHVTIIPRRGGCGLCHCGGAGRAAPSAMLPPSNGTVGRESMLHEQQMAIGAQDAPHFAQRRDDLRYRAQRPGRHHRVEDSIIEWDHFSRCFHQFRSRRRLPASSSQRRGEDRCRGRSPLGRHRKADLGRSDFQHTTAGLRHDPPPVFDEPAVGHGEMGEAWHDMIAIQRHDVRPR
jgi:hypothetical protein